MYVLATFLHWKLQTRQKLSPKNKEYNHSVYHVSYRKFYSNVLSSFQITSFNETIPASMLCSVVQMWRI